MVISVTVYAQFEGFRNYNVKDGLPGSDLYGVMQDSKGYIWTIGDMGVSRFNGYEFKNFSIENGLPENTVLKIYEDYKHRIWFCTFSGKLCYYQNDSIYSLPCNDTLKRLIETGIITSIHIDEGDTLWLGSNVNCIFKIKPGRKANDVEKRNLYKSEYIYKLTKGHFLFGGIAHAKHNIEVFGLSGKKLYSINTGIIYTGLSRLRYYASCLNNGTYMASIGNRLFCLKDSAVQFSREIQSGIIDFVQDDKDNLIVCTFRGAFVYQEHGKGAYKSIKQLQNKVITGACVDREKGMWFATEGHGLYYIPYCNFKYYTPANGISESKVSCIGFSGAGIIAGHLDGKLSLLTEDSVAVYTLRSKETSNTGSLRIYDVKEIKGQTLITTSCESFMFKNGKAEVLNYDRLKNLRQIIYPAPGYFWALRHHSVMKVSSVPPYAKLDTIKTMNRIDQFFQDSKGNLWLSIFKDGIFTYANGKLNRIFSDTLFFNSRSTDITETFKKHIWIATRGNGILIKKESGLAHLTEQNGLAGNMCRCLFADSACVWVGTNKGLSKITGDKGTYHIENYFSENGLLTNEVNQIIKYKGKIWLVHNNGVSVFDPADIKNNGCLPPVYVTDVLVNDKLLVVKGRELKHDENNILISYVGLSYKDAEHPEYKYKTEGLDPDWVTTKYTSARYNKIPAGTYTFKVYARNNDGYWSTTPAVFTFTVLPAWWQTCWFILMCIVSGAGLVAVLFKIRLRNIQKTEFEKEMWKRRIATVELQALRSQMNPHFVFNAISSVQYFIHNNDADSSQKYLEKFASLIRYVLDNSKLTPIPLQKEIEALTLYMELESLRFKFNYKITIEGEATAGSINIPSMLIQPYIENAIWHGLMHKKGIGNISITFKIQEHDLTCIIKDDGIGRKRSHDINLKKGGIKTHRSMGMSITRERLDIINTVNNSDLRVTITDLENNLKEATGTVVEIHIPFD